VSQTNPIAPKRRIDGLLLRGALATKRDAAPLLLLVGWLREFKWEEENHAPVQADDPDQDGTTG